MENNKSDNMRKRTKHPRQVVRTPQGNMASQGGRQKTNAKDNYNKYISLAKDAASSGDHVEAESFYQHAEHYLRQLLLKRAAAPRPKLA